MDTSRRNNVPPCKDDDDIWYWGYSIFVPHIPNTRAYPYVSRIMGPDPKYRLARKFLQYQWPPKTPKGRRFDVELPGDGVYEVGIKRGQDPATGAAGILAVAAGWQRVHHPQMASAAAGGGTTKRHSQRLRK